LPSTRPARAQRSGSTNHASGSRSNDADARLARSRERRARTFDARVSVALLDPRDKVRAEAAADVSVRAGKNSLSSPLELPYAELLEAERKEFPWYRLRYRVAPESGATASAVEGVVSLSEVTPDLFELRVITSRKARAGSQLRARVRTVNPVTGRAVKGVAVAGELKFDDGSDPVRLEGFGRDGRRRLRHARLPSAASGRGRRRRDLKITARRGLFEDSAESSVSVEQKPRVIITTDKPLYQPGQTMHARALVFDPSDHAIAGEAVTLKLEDSDNSTVFSTETKTSRYGIATADWPIPESTKLGWYTLSVEMEDSRYDTDYGASRSVRISRYDLPNFTVATKPDRPYYLAGQNAEVEVRGDYLFGQPVKRGRVRVVRQTERRWDYAEQKYVTEEHNPVEGVLDEQGRFVARLDLSKEHAELADSGYQRFRRHRFAAYVTDPTTNRTEQRRFNVRLTKDPIHVYVNEGRYTQAKGLPLAFYVSTSYADGTPAECEVSVIEEGLKTSTQHAGEPRREVKEPDKTILKVRTNRYGVAKVSGPLVKRDEARANIPLRFVARDRRGAHGPTRGGLLAQGLLPLGGARASRRDRQDHLPRRRARQRRTHVRREPPERSRGRDGRRSRRSTRSPCGSRAGARRSSSLTTRSFATLSKSPRRARTSTATTKTSPTVRARAQSSSRATAS
jgi:hypothetical protein